jgi:hypothetical protein
LPDAVSRKDSDIQPIIFARDSRTVVYSFARGDDVGLRATVGAEPPVVIAPDEKALAYVALGGERRTIKVAEWPTFAPIAEFQTAAHAVVSLSLSNEARRVAARLVHRERKWWEWIGTFRTSLQSWDVATKRELLKLSGTDAMSLTTDGRTLVTQSGPYDEAMPWRVVGWDLSTGRPRRERDLSDGRTAWLGDANHDSFNDRVTFLKQQNSTVADLYDWVVTKGWDWPFRYPEDSRSGEVVEAESGDVVAVPHDPTRRILQSLAGPITVHINEGNGGLDNRWPTVEVWDVPPGKSVTWLAAGAMLLALPPFLIARRRVCRLRREAAA